MLKSIYPFGRFWAKLLTDKQTNRRTNNDENLTSLAEVIDYRMKIGSFKTGTGRHGSLHYFVYIRVTYVL